MAGTIVVEPKSRRQGHSKVTQRPIQQNVRSLTKRLQILRANGAGSLNTSVGECGAGSLLSSRSRGHSRRIGGPPRLSQWP